MNILANYNIICLFRDFPYLEKKTEIKALGTKK